MGERSAGTKQDVLVFASGDELYAVESLRASEVVTPEGLTALPGARPHVRGVFSHRGEVIPVIELGALFGTATARSPDEEGAARVVIVRADRGVYALLATRVLGVEAHELDPHTVGRGGLASAIRPPLERGGEIVTVVDADGLLALLSEGRTGA